MYINIGCNKKENKICKKKKCEQWQQLVHLYRKKYMYYDDDYKIQHKWSKNNSSFPN